MIARLAAIVVLSAIPALSAAQDLCQGRAGCRQGEAAYAGRSDDGQRLRVIPVTVPTATDLVGARLCSSDLDEYWLIVGAAPPVLAGTVCASVGISEGIAVTIGDNQLSAAFAGPGGCCQSIYDIRWRLSPLRLERLSVCDAYFGDHPRFAQTTIEPQTLRGEGAGFLNAPRPVAAEATDLGCSPRRALQHWLVVPRLDVDVAALRLAGAGLGSCAAVMGASGGYVLAGRRTTAEVRILATGRNTVLIQVLDPDLALSRRVNATRRSELEVVASYSAMPVPTPEAETRVGSGRVDLETGTWESGAWAQGLQTAGGGPQLQPVVTHWTTRLADGRAAQMFQLTYPAGESADDQLNFTVIYNQIGGGGVRLRLASSQVRPRQASSLGQSFDVSAFSRCTVQGGVLDLTGAGLVTAPFEANEAAGLRAPS